jgi:hypothetical protein
MVQKTCKMSEQASTDWGPVLRVSGVLTNYSDLWAALKDEEDGDGIYKFKDDDNNECIGINADAIATGALCVGPTPQLDGNNVTNWNNNILYAAIDNSENAIVGLAGWTVNSDKLINRSGT